MPVLTIAGGMRDASFQQARALGEALVESKKGLKLKVEEMNEMEWKLYLEKKKPELGGAAYAHTQGCLIIHSSEGYLGGLREFEVWARSTYNFDASFDSKAGADLAEKRFDEYRAATKNEFVFLDLKFGEKKETSRLIFELFVETCPNTSKNFLQLCTGEIEKKGSEGCDLHYKGNPIHRIVPGGWAQGGDIKSGSGNGGASIYGKTFVDESFSIKHDRIGVLAMANNGVHTNGSQFYITFKALPFLDETKVAFGHVIDGYETLMKLQEAPLKNQRPDPAIIIADCGKLV